VVPRFCRHNRFVAECPICSKGTVLDPNRQAERRPRRPAARRPGAKHTVQAASGVRVSRGEFAAAGPYEGGREVRLEKVPGGLRLASWHAGQLVKGAPVLALSDLPSMLGSATGQGLLPSADLPGRGPGDGDPAIGMYGASPGRTGELRDELRVERLDDSELRIARWIMRPNRGWELQEAPVLLPADRFVGALASAAERGVLASGDPTE
jgi:hypothetical protein